MCWFHGSGSARRYWLSHNSGVDVTHVFFRFGEACLWMLCGVCLATESTLGLCSAAAMGPYQWFLVRSRACHCHTHLRFPSYRMAGSFKWVPLETMPAARESQGQGPESGPILLFTTRLAVSDVFFSLLSNIHSGYFDY